MAWSFVAAASAKQTTSAIDTTGADLIVLAIGSNASALTVSDSKGNTWTALTNHNAAGPPSIGSRLYYCVNPTVGSGHTFTVSHSYGAISATAYSGVGTSPFDQQNGATSVPLVSALATGSITPTENGELVIASLGVGKTASSIAIDSSYSIDTYVNPVSGVAYGVAIASLIQTTAGATNPSWSWGGGTSEAAASIASFKVAAGGTSIAGALGTATASGYTGTVNANRTIAGALGTATASGFIGTVSNSTDTTITGALGVAAASGFAGTVGANRGIAGALGTAVASGFAGTVSNTNDSVIGGALGIAIASGLIGGINANRTIAGTLGTAVASGFVGSVSNGSTTDLALILKILRNRQELNPATGTFTLYDDDSTTVLYTASAWADAAGTVPYSGGALRRIDALA